MKFLSKNMFKKLDPAMKMMPLIPAEVFLLDLFIYLYNVLLLISFLTLPPHLS